METVFTSVEILPSPVAKETGKSKTNGEVREYSYAFTIVVGFYFKWWSHKLDIIKVLLKTKTLNSEQPQTRSECEIC